MAQQEVETEGFFPLPPKVGASYTLRIHVNNTDNYLDLQYGDHDLEDANQAPLKTTGTHAVDNTLAVNQYKALEERLKVVEGFDAFKVDALEMGLVPDVVIPPKFSTWLWKIQGAHLSKKSSLYVLQEDACPCSRSEADD